MASFEQLRPDYRAALGVMEESPRLYSFDAGETVLTAPLLPPPQAPLAEGEKEERFCVGGPDISSCGQPRKSTSVNTAMSFADVVARMEAAMGQASLLLNDRLRTLQSRCQGVTLPPAQATEICEIADGVAAAAYHAQKWAFALRSQVPKLDIQDTKPTRPYPCESPEEAFAALHITLPRLMVNSTLAQNALGMIVKAHGEAAEAKVVACGVSLQDLRALAPHLERLVLRLGRLSTAVRAAPTLREFVPEYFRPILGRKLAYSLLGYLVEGPRT